MKKIIIDNEHHTLLLAISMCNFITLGYQHRTKHLTHQQQAISIILSNWSNFKYDQQLQIKLMFKNYLTSPHLSTPEYNILLPITKQPLDKDNRKNSMCFESEQDFKFFVKTTIHYASTRESEFDKSLLFMMQRVKYQISNQLYNILNNKIKNELCQQTKVFNIKLPK